jgi:hypothetical protein
MGARVDARALVVRDGATEIPFAVDCGRGVATLDPQGEALPLRVLRWGEKCSLARFADAGPAFVEWQVLAICGGAAIERDAPLRPALAALARWLHGPDAPALPLDPFLLGEVTIGLCAALRVGPADLASLAAPEVEALWRAAGVADPASAAVHEAAAVTVPDGVTRILIEPDPPETPVAVADADGAASVPTAPRDEGLATSAPASVAGKAPSLPAAPGLPGHADALRASRADAAPGIPAGSTQARGADAGPDAHPGTMTATAAPPVAATSPAPAEAPAGGSEPTPRAASIAPGRASATPAPGAPSSPAAAPRLSRVDQIRTRPAMPAAPLPARFRLVEDNEAASPAIAAIAEEDRNSAPPGPAQVDDAAPASRPVDRAHDIGPRAQARAPAAPAPARRSPNRTGHGAASRPAASSAPPLAPTRAAHAAAEAPLATAAARSAPAMTMAAAAAAAAPRPIEPSVTRHDAAAASGRAAKPARLLAPRVTAAPHRGPDRTNHAAASRPAAPTAPPAAPTRATHAAAEAPLAAAAARSAPATTMAAAAAAAAPRPFEPSATRHDAAAAWGHAATPARPRAPRANAAPRRSPAAEAAPAPAIDARLGALIEIVTRASGSRAEPEPDSDTMIDTFADRLAEAAAELGLAGMD